MTADRKLRVFLCHASQDKPIVRELYQRLNAEGWIDPWLDEEKLLPGQDWDMEIEKTVEATDAVIVCLSNNSITKEGYVQRELKFVLDIALEKPEGTIFIIPLRLDNVQPPRRLRSWQYVDYFPLKLKSNAYQRLLTSLKTRSTNLSNMFDTIGIVNSKSIEMESNNIRSVQENIQECPICGKNNKLENTFRCKSCQRPYMCLSHQNPKTLMCEDCTMKSKSTLLLKWRGPQNGDYNVWLDNTRIGVINYDDEIKLQIDPGNHKIYIMDILFSSKLLEFTAGSNQTIRLVQNGGNPSGV